MAESRCCITNNGKYDTEWDIDAGDGGVSVWDRSESPGGDFDFIPHAPLGGSCSSWLFPSCYTVE